MTRKVSRGTCLTVVPVTWRGFVRLEPTDSAVSTRALGVRAQLAFAARATFCPCRVGEFSLATFVAIGSPPVGLGVTGGARTTIVPIRRRTLLLVLAGRAFRTLCLCIGSALSSIALNAEALSRVVLVPSVGAILTVVVGRRRVFVLVCAWIAADAIPGTGRCCTLSGSARFARGHSRFTLIFSS